MALLKKRIWTFIFLVVATSLGFCMWHYYEGWQKVWVRYYLSGALYVIIFSLAAFVVWPRRTAVIKIPIVVFIATCMLEFLQLYKPVFLQAVRATLPGAALLGTCFVWMQFPYYLLGAVLSVFILATLAAIK